MENFNNDKKLAEFQSSVDSLYQQNVDYTGNIKLIDSYQESLRFLLWSLFEGVGDDLSEPHEILGIPIAEIRFVFELQELEFQIETAEEQAYNTWGKKSIIVDFNGLTFNGKNLSERRWALTNDKMTHDEVWNFMYACVGKYVPISFKFV